ncbi:MAG TPA: hypothetical protein VHV28_00625 [Solirubrobacteraceae bacterium]|jgi:hypothetical protein|nr:hypothetical protein [Solirubrobacteraceae bacterium]
MKIPIRDAPPPITIPVSYRNLYEHGAFGQRELVTDSGLRSLAQDRDLARWIGQEAPEAVDRRGALCPIAFAVGGYFTGFSTPSVPVEELRFREETAYRPWSDYAWEAWGHPEVSALYSPWQTLYLDVVTRESAIELPLDVAAMTSEELAGKLGPIQPWVHRQRDLLEEIDAAWRPLIKLLVIAQNVYWPRVSGRVSVHPVRPGMTFVDAGLTDEDPQSLLAGAGCTADEIQSAYYFLVERGLRREPEDGLVMLRRSVPRAYHVRWGGSARQAQDHFDAAQVLYLWLTDLRGEPPNRPDAWPLDGRQLDRMALYDHGPGSEVLGDKLKRELIAVDLYPSGPIVVGEGDSERIIIDWLVLHLVGLRNAFEFYDLEGDGGAKRIGPLVEALKHYAPEAFVVVDDEGEMARYVERLVADDKLSPEHVLLASDSLEGDNFTDDELILTVAEIAAHPPDGRVASALRLTAEELRTAHNKRREAAQKDKPGIAKTLLTMARSDEHGNVNVSKRELAEGLARLLIREIEAATPEQAESLKARRPIVRFTADSICEVLNPPRPIS